MAHGDLLLHLSKSVGYREGLTWQADAANLEGIFALAVELQTIVWAPLDRGLQALPARLGGRARHA